jgi:hypothetical protein
MELLAGLMDHQVLQRNRKNVCESVLVGKTETAGEVTACVASKGKPLTGWKGKKLATVKAGEFECVLTGIPTGGPYTISLQVGKTEEIIFKDILVGDVWILGGQSNMEGLGLLTEATDPHPLVRAFYMDDHWGVAKEPIHKLGIAIDPIHLDMCGGVPMDRGPLLGAGPGIAFGRRLVERSGIPQGVICCAHGGASMDQWSPDLKDRSGKTLYSAMLRRVWRNGGRVAGVVWYQGCTDAATEALNAGYTDKMIRMVSEMRKDFSNAGLPVIVAQLARLYNSPWAGMDEKESALWAPLVKGWNNVRDQQRLLPRHIRRLAVVPTIDLPLSDFVHLSGRGQEILGGRMAEAAWTLMGGKKCQLSPISVKSVRKVLGLSLGSPVRHIEVTFDSVIGSLRSEGLATGFTLTDWEGKLFPQIFHVELQGNKAILKTSMVEARDFGQLGLYYGYSTNAHCNITDEGGRSIPVFGPISIIEEDDLYWKALKVRRTPLLPGAGQLHSVCCPDINDPSMEWKSQSFPIPFWNLHEEIEPNKDDKMLFYHLPFQCDERMRLLIGLGYDGPIRVWLDRKEILFDPKGTNPMIYDQKKIKVNAAAGRHDLIIAFSCNFGKAWGVGLKVYRKDVPKAIMKKGSQFYKMPHDVE